MLQNVVGLAKRCSAEVSGDAWTLAFPDPDRVKYLPGVSNQPVPVSLLFPLPRQYPHWCRVPRPPQGAHSSHETDAPRLARQSVGARIWPSALHVRANADGLRTRTGPLEAGVVVLVPILVRGTRMQLRHCARPLSGGVLHRSTVRLILDLIKLSTGGSSPGVVQGRNGLNRPPPYVGAVAGRLWVADS